MIRATTNGVLKSYRSNLMTSFIKLNSARDTVLSQRAFNSFAEDPAAATQAFQLRRSYLRTSSQYTISDQTIRKFEMAYSSLDSVVNMVDNAMDDPGNTALGNVMQGLNDPSGEGRNALGKQLIQLADSIVQTMNSKYGENFVFAGADGLNVPFEWVDDGSGGRTLQFRGVNVDTMVPQIERDPATGNPSVVDADGNPTNGAPGTHYRVVDAEGNVTGTIAIADYEKAQADLEKLKYLSEEEGTFVDIGLGLQEDENGELIESSAFNAALQGINFLGYGVDEDGLPNNVASIIQEMGELFSNCPDTGVLDADTRERLEALFNKLGEASDNLQGLHVELSAQAQFLKNNHEQLETSAYTLNEQFLGIEQVDLADAITAFSWARYCYNTALKVGNSILSQSLMDYLS